MTQELVYYIFKIENLSKRIKEVLEGLNHVEVDYEPNTDNRD
ncbi:hypothetical protein BAOM_3677 [Peribacillus asahii]|uniref:Uncharacterized protein n=1 Tax=Peribacillus asahii TaxID=228899 RepID=A0A3T0KV56_9BACI|nr:hypothetical protein BAOM_3677 [Peribacillus asahii]